MSDNNALVIAGGQWQVPIIQFLLNKNYKVTVADPYDTSPGVLIADHHIKADVRDKNRILELVKDHKFDLVTTDQSDIAVETVAFLASYFNLCGNSEDVVKKFTNKFLSRQFASEIGIPVPQFYKVYSIDEGKQVISESESLAMILKPVDSQSSRGIFKIDASNKDDISELAALTFKESLEKYILVEEFFEGTELTVEGICSGGKHKTLAISQKKHFRTGIASDLIYPAVLPSEIEEEIIRHNDNYAEKSGLKFGITHAEYLYNAESGKICLVEIACRGGGSLISSDIAKWVSGIDLYEIFFKSLTGINTDLSQLSPLKRPAILHFFEATSGIVEEIEGLEQIKEMEGVIMIKMDFNKGDYIKPAKDDRSRQGFVIIVADNKAQLDERLKEVTNTLKVTVRKIEQ